MGFVKTREEIARIAASLTDVQFRGGEYIGVDFESDPAFIEAVLPPGLEPRGNQILSAMVCRFQGGSAGPFTGGAIYVAARHGNIEGKYTLAMYMNSDNAMLFGRDIFGEPKKLAYVEFDASREKGGGHVDRGGARLIEIDARFDADFSLDSAVDIDFNYKASLAADGNGMAADPLLTVSELHLAPTIFRTGMATLKLNGTIHDPLHEIPVKRIVGAQYIASDFQARCRVSTAVPADEFLPYAYGRMPDWSVFTDAWEAGKPAAVGDPVANRLIGAESVR